MCQKTGLSDLLRKFRIKNPRCLGSVRFGFGSIPISTSDKCKKTVVYHLVNGSTVLLRIENSKNDRLKVILLVAV